MIKTGYSQKYSFINYSTKEGLAQSQVNDIKQDKNKYLWVATLDGLSKFNGISFENFYVSDGLLSNRIMKLSIKSNRFYGKMKWSGGHVVYL
ncbi:MAG: two-component regulator propeller domain-containing protein, partial [Flavobacteriales bacterium]